MWISNVLNICDIVRKVSEDKGSEEQVLVGLEKGVQGVAGREKGEEGMDVCEEGHPR